MNVPKLRFKEFNDEYKSIKLKDVSEIYDGTHETPNYVKKGVKFVSVENISNLLETTKFIPESDYNKYKIKPKYNDIFMTRIGDIGTSSIYKSDEKLAYYVSLALLRTKDNHILIPDYLNQYIKNNSFQKELYNRTIHVAFPKKINTGEIGECSINLCSDKEQLKVSNFLSLLDKKIELQTKKIEDLKLFKLYTENSLLNSSSSIHWKKLKLNDILIEGNKEPVKNTNDFKKITIKLNLNGLEFNESKREMSDKRPFYIREENEIIIGKQNYFNGSIAIVTKEFSGCICSNAIMSFKVKEGYNLNYIYLYLSQKRYMKEREFLANGTGQKELSEKEFLKFTIKVPEDSVVNNITTIIDKINKKINFENNKLNKLIELKKGLMQNMFV